MTTAPYNNRASLLSGLRTGGVRSTSTTIPHTAAPGASFNIPRFASQNHQSVFPEEDEEDQVAEMPAQNVYVNKLYGGKHHMTAAVDGPNNRFAQQQQRGMNPNSAPFTPSFATVNAAAQPASANAQSQAFQMQLMQMEILRLQALQAQQLQVEMLAQAHLQQQQQQQAQTDKSRRVSTGFNPMSAGPTSQSFDLRSATVSAQLRRARQDQANGDDQLPMTAALGGRFGSRVPSMPIGQVNKFPAEGNNSLDLPSTPGGTTVISGGTSLGSSSNTNATTSKSDSVSSWRRADKNNSVLRNNNRAVSSTSPSVRITPPEQHAPPPGLTRARPQPLQFSPAVSQPLPAITVDTSDGVDDEEDSTSSSKSGSGTGSSPTTPHSTSSNDMPLSPREEASKKLYEGLGIGRPRSSASNAPVSGANGVVQPVEEPVSVGYGYRLASQPTRQPRGPPSGPDELGPKNFATRIRRKAIGGLGMLMGARERRELVEVF